MNSLRFNHFRVCQTAAGRLAPLASWLSVVIPALLLAACSPVHDWREVHGATSPSSYVVLLPAKPDSFVREINLDGVSVTMAMTAARVEGTSFAVGSASLPDPAAARIALMAMKTAMLRNIRGTVLKETAGTMAPDAAAFVDIDAIGTGPDGQALHLAARFASHGKQVWQAVVIGSEKAWLGEAAETFLASFKPG